MDEEEQAFWLACLSLFSLLIGPVYKYNQITAKVLGFFRGIFDCISYVFYLVVVNPASKAYESLKYFFLLKWVPGMFRFPIKDYLICFLGLLGYLRSFGSYVYQLTDEYFLQYIRTMNNRIVKFFEYWIYFHWLKDMNSWSRRNIYDPIAQKLAVLKDGFVYVFGGYWFYPALQFTGRQLKKASIVVLGWANQFAIMVGNSVLWPVAVVCYQQLKEVYMIFHQAAVQPVLDVIYVKYKYVEDMAYIYVLGPFCKKVVESVPEKNPFAGAFFG